MISAVASRFSGGFSGCTPVSTFQSPRILVHTGSVRRKWWSSGSTLRYLNIELDQKRSMRSCTHQHSTSLYVDTPAYPVVYLTVSDGVVDAVAGACCRSKRFVANEEVEVFSSALPRKVSARSSAAGQK
jgi:hypothetical protein